MFIGDFVTMFFVIGKASAGLGGETDFCLMGLKFLLWLLGL